MEIATRELYPCVTDQESSYLFLLKAAVDFSRTKRGQNLAKISYISLKLEDPSHDPTGLSGVIYNKA